MSLDNREALIQSLFQKERAISITPGFYDAISKWYLALDVSQCLSVPTDGEHSEEADRLQKRSLVEFTLLTNLASDIHYVDSQQNKFPAIDFAPIESTIDDLFTRTIQDVQYSQIDKIITDDEAIDLQSQLYSQYLAHCIQINEYERSRKLLDQPTTGLRTDYEALVSNSIVELLRHGQKELALSWLEQYNLQDKSAVKHEMMKFMESAGDINFFKNLLRKNSSDKNVPIAYKDQHLDHLDQIHASLARMEALDGNVRQSLNHLDELCSGDLIVDTALNIFDRLSGVIDASDQEAVGLYLLNYLGDKIDWDYKPNPDSEADEADSELSYGRFVSSFQRQEKSITFQEYMNFRIKLARHPECVDLLYEVAIDGAKGKVDKEYLVDYPYASSLSIAELLLNKGNSDENLLDWVSLFVVAGEKKDRTLLKKLHDYKQNVIEGAKQHEKYNISIILNKAFETAEIQMNPDNKMQVFMQEYSDEYDIPWEWTMPALFLCSNNIEEWEYCMESIIQILESSEEVDFEETRIVYDPNSHKIIDPDGYNHNQVEEDDDQLLDNMMVEVTPDELSRLERLSLETDNPEDAQLLQYIVNNTVYIEEDVNEDAEEASLVDQEERSTLEDELKQFIVSEIRDFQRDLLLLAFRENNTEVFSTLFSKRNIMLTNADFALVLHTIVGAVRDKKPITISTEGDAIIDRIYEE